MSQKAGTVLELILKFFVNQLIGEKDMNTCRIDLNQSLQKQYANKSICYGCGPANSNGLQIESFVTGDKIIAKYTPKPYHNAFPNVLNGGIIATLLDCHCNWAACYYLMQSQNLSEPPCTVTAEYTVKLLRPTPMGKLLRLEARCEKINDNQAVINGELIANEKICDTFTGKFIAVNEGHPAFYRW